MGPLGEARNGCGRVTYVPTPTLLQWGRAWGSAERRFAKTRKKAVSCFNGAALGEARNACPAGLPESRSKCFNGAALWERGTADAALGPSAEQLASMGPRSGKRGTPCDSDTDPRVVALQWGRAGSAERARAIQNRRAPRVFNGAALGKPRTRLPLRRRAHRNLLQWGRAWGRRGTHRSACRWPARSPRFNGAAWG